MKKLAWNSTFKKTKIMVSSPSLYGKQMGGKCKQWQILFSGAPKSLQMVTVTMKLKDISPWKKSYDRPKQHIKKQRHHADNKCPYSQSCSFSSSYVWMWELDHKDGWTPKNWCFWTVVLDAATKTQYSQIMSRIILLKKDGNWLYLKLFLWANNSMPFVHIWFINISKLKHFLAICFWRGVST